MADINYTITFFSDWHCGSGLSSGSESDTLVKKNKDELPFVPGKTIKGMIKEAAKDLFEGDEDYAAFIEGCFGTKAEKDTQKPDYQFFYSDAELPIDEASYFKSNPIEKNKLYRNLPSTRIEEKTGIAKNKSLRTMEVTIPLKMNGTITNIPDDHLDKMIDCMNMIKRLGVKRNRGLGRCQFEIIEEKKGGQQ